MRSGAVLEVFQLGDKDMDARQEARADLAAVLRWSARLGFNEGIDNHYSVLVPGTEDRFIINPVSYTHLTLPTILLV